jgi:hypothetical protein
MNREYTEQDYNNYMKVVETVILRTEELLETYEYRKKVFSLTFDQWVQWQNNVISLDDIEKIMIPKEEARKVTLKNLKGIRDSTSLETSIRIGISMADYDNWDNGDYNGDRDLINRQVDIVLSNIEEWVKNNYINPIRKKDEL